MEVIDQIEEYASLFLTIDEIALLLDLDANALRREILHGGSPIAKAYQKGKLMTIVEVRRQTVFFAKKGSPQAADLIKDYISNQIQNE